MTTARSFATGVLLLSALLAWEVDARTAILKAGEGWQLRVDGQPYVAKGVTFSGSGGPANFDRDCEQLKSLGVNTLRTWGTGDETPLLLDAAHKHGLRVLVGLWLRPGRAGMLSGTSKRPAWHAVREAYTGVKPEPALPVPVRLEVRGVEKEWANVAFDVTSATPLDVSFAYNFRGAATREERDRVTVLESRKGTTPGMWLVRLPAVTGAIKLYGLAKDGAGNLVAATTSVAP
ncbi:hypothetical protein D7X55_26780 [Corallococcus sp. AB049A]|uniref:Uncharacterized protein n=1 Tax=Corallococcus interemptor TaxID=2316720 RepID=A0A3A8QWL2_9BACT|nr:MULTISPECIES: hypothetical protein [Corallococcus]RKH50309.1 hypothetical protein D7Y23_13780 [Corallococcus sp. AB050B]RKH72118.1 hypothetical protein D7X96_05830 [Corallococcus interemptor]RKI58738.1 hypothetical protein D7X55_26780 [Corallococcus sp. AB049A]